MTILMTTISREHSEGICSGCFGLELWRVVISPPLASAPSSSDFLSGLSLFQDWDRWWCLMWYFMCTLLNLQKHWLPLVAHQLTHHPNKNHPLGECWMTCCNRVAVQQIFNSRTMFCHQGYVLTYIQICMCNYMYIYIYIKSTPQKDRTVVFTI